MPFTIFKTAKVAIFIRKSVLTLPVEQIIFKFANIDISTAKSICAMAIMLTVFPFARVRVFILITYGTRTISPNQT